MSDPRYHILMSDVIKSRRYPGRDFMAGFGRLVAACNQDLAAAILSPLTITLGDEFQGVMASLAAACEAVFWLEEARLRQGFLPRLRYVIVLGEIETELNREIAHGMVGAGLTLARELLTAQKRARPEVALRLGDPYLERQLGALFQLMLAISQGWRPADYGLVAAMLGRPRDREVAELFGKDPSQIWRRRRTLQIREYNLAKAVIRELLAREGAGCRAGR